MAAVNLGTIRSTVPNIKWVSDIISLLTGEQPPDPKDGIPIFPRGPISVAAIILELAHNESRNITRLHVIPTKSGNPRGSSTAVDPRFSRSYR
jgi:hypothetical protein